jgi:MauM/NapG family ferredoxin protein
MKQTNRSFSISLISQLIFLAIFLVLFVTTDYRGQDTISVAINSFFRSDALVLTTYFLSAKSFTLLLLPALVLLVSSLVLGRFFCGWICPLGTIIDLITRKIRKTAPLRFLRGNLRHYLLFTLLFAALFGINVAGILDPIGILIRFLTFLLYPLVGLFARQGWAGLYTVFGDRLDSVDPAYQFLKTYLLPFRETFYPLAFTSLVIFGLILLIERYEERNWCKNLCPLGTLLGLCSRFSLFRRIPGRLCKDCGDCKDFCPTAFDEEILQKEKCILCLDCQSKCPHGRVRFTPGLRAGGRPAFSEGRRVFVGSFLSGIVLSRVFSYKPPQQEQRLLRPPGVAEESGFLAKCVRCGECMKVCPRNALYPAVLQAGLYGVYTPVVIPRLGYCEYYCNLCGQVCPTAAIPSLPLPKKQKSIIGLAVLDKNHCLPYGKRMNCIVCEEHCPIPEKAIRFEEVEETDYTGKKVVLRKPYVVEELCNGCGICEYVCPVEEKAAIEVFGKNRRRASK